LFQTYGLPPALYPATLVVVCCLALWRGGRDERMAAFGILVGWLLTIAVVRATGGRQTGVFIVDLCLLGVLLWIALRSAAWWPLFAAGFHLLAILTDVAHHVDRQLGAWAYLTAQVIWGYMLALTVGIGAWRAPTRQLAISEPPTTPPATRR
jgi:hypothetical protein